jgi:diguanylate cyclase (GGDEF)-like protein
VSPGAVCASSVLLIVLVGLVDYLTGYRLRLSIFYLLPVLWTAWRLGKAVGLTFAAAAAGVWLWADLAARPPGSGSLVPYWNALVTLALFAVAVLVLSAFRQERSVARTCPLTGLPNRLAFFEAVDDELERVRRYSRPLSVVYLDLDDFKAVNDRHGHRAGDAVLKAVAGVLVDGVRSTDLPARLGGDEFAVLLPEAVPDSAEAVADKLRAGVEAATRPWAVGCSVGVATFMRAPASADEFLRAADEEMYSAKRAGKGTLRRRVVGNP